MSQINQWLERTGLDGVPGLAAAFLGVADDLSEVQFLTDDEVVKICAPLQMKELKVRKVQHEVQLLREVDAGGGSSTNVTHGLGTVSAPGSKRGSQQDLTVLGGASASAVELPAKKARTKPSAAGDDALFLGIDLSTQSATGVIMDGSLRVRHRKSINFDESCPEFGTSAGMHVRHLGSGQTAAMQVSSPVGMWLKALDILMAELVEAAGSALMRRVASISCSGQQHGSVYLTDHGVRALRATAASAKETEEASASSPTGFSSIFTDLSESFALTDCPIWADSSTEQQCLAIEAALGGAAAVATRTGSRAYSRFTGPQIAALAERKPSVWERTAAVTLISSFLASLLLGDVAPIDVSDGSGMNLMDLSSRRWDDAILTSEPMPKGLSVALLAGQPVPSFQVLGRVSALVRQSWGLSASCVVIASSGDNPCTLAGLGLAQPGDLALSLGTSDTLLGVARAEEARPRVEGHIMAHPTDPDAVFAMLCYKNGGVARQAVRDERCGSMWVAFDEALRSTPPGNDGLLGLYLPLPEITPVVPGSGQWFVDRQGRRLNEKEVPSASAVRSVIEGRFLSMRARGEALGLRQQRHCVLATGGGSKSSEILQVAADVFDSIVLVGVPTSDAAAIGAARRAAHALEVHIAHDGDVSQLPFHCFVSERSADPALVVAARPRPWAVAKYEGMHQRYQAFEDAVRKEVTRSVEASQKRQDAAVEPVIW